MRDKNRGLLSALLHDNQQRASAPSEKEQNIEIVFSPEPAQEMLLACLYRYVEPEGDEGVITPSLR